MIPRVNISQYDTGARVLKFQVYNGDSLFTFTNAMSVALVGTKPDGKGFSYEGTIASNMPTFDVTAQMSAVAGKVRAELIVFENGERCGSGNFVIFVEEAALGDGTDMSDSDYAIINDALEAAFDLDHFYADLQNMVADAVEDIQVIQGQTVIDPTLTVSGAAADAKATGDLARKFLDALMTETVGPAAIVTTDDAAGGLPVKTLTANIEPTQSGTGDPSPDNVRPISGYTGVTVTRTGKNLIDPAGMVRENVFSANADGSYTFTKTAQSSSGRITNICDCRVKAGQMVTFSADITGTPTSGNLIHFDLTATTTGSVRGSVICTVSGGKIIGSCAPIEDTIGARLYWQNNSTGIGDSVVLRNIQVEYGETATEYAGAAEVDTYTITFPTAAGTVYGGTLVVYADGSGTLTVDRAEIASYAGETLPGEWISDRDVYSAGTTPTTGAQVVYKLATPTTYALSAVQVAIMLNGVNNVWTDANGTLTAEYYANTSLYVDKKVNAQRNMIAGVEEAMIATKNYSVNDLLIVGNTLYKVTAAISSGAALVVGTNVTETTVAEQLLALA